MSILRIYRKGFQTWNDDFLQWIDQYNGQNNSFSEAPVLNTDDFSGTLYLASMVGGYYHLYGQLQNLIEIDTSGDTGLLQQEICDFSSIFPVTTMATITVPCGIRDDSAGESTYRARVATLQFAGVLSKLYVSNGITIPINQTWSIEVYLYSGSTVNASLLSIDVQRKLKKARMNRLTQQGAFDVSFKN